MAPQQEPWHHDTMAPGIEISCTCWGHSFPRLFFLPQPSFQAQAEDHSQYGSDSLLEEEEAEIGRNIRCFGSRRCHPCKGNLLCRHILFPLGNPGLSFMQEDPAVLQMQTTGVTCFGYRLEPNGGKSNCLDFCSCYCFSCFRVKEEAWRPLT